MKLLNILVHYPGKSDMYGQLLRDQLHDEVDLFVCDDIEAIREAIPEAEVLLVATSFPAQLLASAGRLQWIQVLGAGVERFIENGIPEGVLITRVNTGFGHPIAEYVLAHLLSRTQCVREAAEAQRSGEWNLMKVSRLRGEVLGVIGVGAVGEQIALRAKAFGMTVWGLDLQASDHPALDRSLSLDRMSDFLRGAKYVVLCLPLTGKTRGMFGAEQLAAMREDAVLVNVARGPVVIEADLIEALRAGAIGGAILDVFDEEPLPQSSPLWAMGNVVVTPHVSGPSLPDEMVEFFAKNLERFRKNEPLEGCVDVLRGF